MRQAYLFFAATNLLLFSGRSAAEPLPLSCKFLESGGRVHLGCSFESREIAPKPAIHAEARIEYVFSCTGHPTGLQIRSEDGTAAPIKFGNGELQILQVQGRGRIIIEDINPQQTLLATLVGDCSIDIRSISILPSSEQLEAWSKEAKTLETSLNDAMDLVVLADRYESLSDLVPRRSKTLIEDMWGFIDQALLAAGFNDGVYHFTDNTRKRLLTQTEMTKDQRDSWENASATIPEIMNYYVTLCSLQALKDSVPLPFEPNQVNASIAATKVTLTQYYAKRLGDRVTKATAFLANIATWRVKAGQDVEIVAQGLESALQEANTP